MTTTPLSVFSNFSSFVSSCDLIPRLRNDFASSAETSSSSERNQPRQQFDDRRLSAKARIDRSELDADGAGAHHDQRFRNFGQFENVIAVDDVFAVSFESGNRPHD